MIMTAKWYSGDLVSLKLPDICLTGEEKPPEKTSPRNLVWTEDRIRAHRKRRACYRLLYSGGRFKELTKKSPSFHSF